ncbi:hypothetical protein F5X97DRAFT_102336 [Nemania serpens]|nr:hypothetical protein F5X97DRAFT_102336 [Nemania serpens]
MIPYVGSVSRGLALEDSAIGILFVIQVPSSLLALSAGSLYLRIQPLKLLICTYAVYIGSWQLDMVFCGTPLYSWPLPLYIAR